MGIENPIHLLFLGAVALLVLGPKRLPDLAKALGNGIREFRESMADGEDGEEQPSPNGSATVDAAGTVQAAAATVTPTATPASQAAEPATSGPPPEAAQPPPPADATPPQGPQSPS